MPKYVLTGVGGQLGRIAANYALELAGPDTQLVFASHNHESLPKQRVQQWTDKGVRVVTADYDDPASLVAAFTGADAVSMISTWDFGEGRRRQAANVIAAAKKCGVKRVCYTSFVGADLPGKEEDVPFLPRDHRVTEQLLYASGLEYNIQRNYLYADNIPTLFAPSWKFCGDRWLANSHSMAGAYVAREDCGRVHAALLLGKAEPNTVHEVTGPEAITDADIFRWICDRSGYQGEFVDMTDDQLKEFWLAHGLPAHVSDGASTLPMKLCADDLLCCGEMVARGFMQNTSDTVERLTGRKPLSVQQVLLSYEHLLPRPT